MIPEILYDFKKVLLDVLKKPDNEVWIVGCFKLTEYEYKELSMWSKTLQDDPLKLSLECIREQNLGMDQVDVERLVMGAFPGLLKG